MLGVHYVKSEASNCFYSGHLGAIARIGKARRKKLCPLKIVIKVKLLAITENNLRIGYNRGQQ
jgi:hypothetical protein